MNDIQNQDGEFSFAPCHGLLYFFSFFIISIFYFFSFLSFSKGQVPPSGTGDGTKIKTMNFFLDFNYCMLQKILVSTEPGSMLGIGWNVFTI